MWQCKPCVALLYVVSYIAAVKQKIKSLQHYAYYLHFFFVMSYESRFHTKRFSIYPLMPDGRKRSYALKQSSS